MAKKYLTHLDLNKNQIQQAVAQVLGSDPSTPVEGQFYYDSTAKRWKYHNGTAFVADTDRARHTGTQLANTISDFDTQVRLSRLDQMAAPTAAVGMNGQRVTGVATPTAATDAANKQYVDDTVASMSWKDEARAATTANIANLAGGAPSTLDGVTLAANDRILVKDQTTPSQNGIYVVTTLGTGANGTWTRASDADTGAELKGAALFVSEGTTNSGTRWVCNVTGGITVGTTSITFVAFGGGATYTNGNGLNLTGNSFSVKPAASGGVVVDTNGVGVDTTVVVRKYATTFGDGSAASYVITHNLGTKDVTVSVREVATDAFVECDIVATSTTQVTLGFTAAVASNALRAVVHG